MSDNGGGEYALRGTYMQDRVFVPCCPGCPRDALCPQCTLHKPAKSETTPPVVPAHIRTEAWRLAGDSAPGATLCQRIQNADIIAQWLHFGRVPQV